MIKACLFDLDGTLLNTLNSIRYYVNKNIAAEGIEGLSETETKIFVGKGAKILIEKVLISRGYNLADDTTENLLTKIHEKYVREYDSEPLYLTEPYGGICELVSDLVKRDIKLAVISNKPDPTVKQLVAHFFGGAFEVVEGANDKMPLKPDPKWPLDICKRLGVEPGEVAYVGDTSTDMKTAANFGAGVAVGVTWGFRDESELLENGADVIVNYPCEILEIVDNKNEWKC